MTEIPIVVIEDDPHIADLLDLYLRREVLASNLMLRAGRRADLERSLDKILSLAGSLTPIAAARIERNDLQISTGLNITFKH